MRMILTFLSGIPNRLTGGNPYKEDVLGALLGALAALLIGTWQVAAAVMLVSLLYRLWEGPSGKGWAYYAWKVFVCALAVRGLLLLEDRSLVVFPAAYWLIFAFLMIGYTAAAKHFFLCAIFLFAMMLVALSGSEENALIAGALLGAVCGFFPQKRKKEGKNVKFV